MSFKSTCIYISSRGVVYGLSKCRHDVLGKRSIKNDEGPPMGPGHSQDTGTMGGGGGGGCFSTRHDISYDFFP